MSTMRRTFPRENKRNGFNTTTATTGTSSCSHRRATSTPVAMKDVTKMVVQMNSQRNLFAAGDGAHDGAASYGSAEEAAALLTSSHRSSIHSLPNSLPSSSYNYNDPAAIPIFDQPQNTKTALLSHAEHLENLFTVGSGRDYTYTRFMEEEEDEMVTVTTARDLEEGSAAAQETTNLLPNTKTTKSQCRHHWWNNCVSIIPPDFYFWKSLRQFLSTTFLFFMVPCMLAAYILYYPLENPDLDILPKASISWFLLLAVRLSVTFTLAKITQFVLQVLTRTPLFVRVAGPLLALVALQSMGWPFLIVAWGIWNFVLLYGSTPFARHWLYWTGIKLFSIQYNAGEGILASDFYGRLLVALIVLGAAASTKRTFVALYMSRRMLRNYRPKLEQTMSQIKLIMEVADLAAQTDKPDFEAMVKENLSQIALERSRTSKKYVETVPTFEKKTTQKYSKAGSKDKLTVHKEDHDDDSGDSEDSVTSAEQELDQAMEGPKMEVVMDSKLFWSSLKKRALNDRDTVNFAGDGSTHTGHRKQQQGLPVPSGGSSYRGTSLGAILPFLDRWHEPEEKSKVFSPTLHDILQFNKAMSFMEGNSTFGPAYGSCSNRKACVKNAVRLYRKLLKFTPDQSMLSFDVIGALAYNIDGKTDEDQAIALLRLFYPDQDDLVPMLAFVQACDNVYKRMRFLRASINNASKIDSVLEDCFDIFFYFVLAISILSVCGLNLWPFLLSLSTLMVSFAFAFGSSVAKNVEGILMIAVRRPYDIGDRITITGAEMVANPTGADTWLVEDITLSKTTLRYAATNQVATINNASVAKSRIVNFARSPKATVTIRIQLDVEASQRQFDDFRCSMEAYLEQFPRKWISLIHYRSEAIDVDEGYVTFAYQAQHCKSWQELGSIMIDKGNWERHATLVATEMGIAFDSGPRQMKVELVAAQNKAAEDRKGVAKFIQSIETAEGSD